MVDATEAARLKAELEQSIRRRDSARSAAELVRKEIESLRAQLAAGAPPAGVLKAGDRVRLVNPEGAAELNGQEAVVAVKDLKKGRVKVRLASGELRQVPGDCLRPLGGRRCSAALARQLTEGVAPLISPSGLLLRSSLLKGASSVPCELLPLVQSCVARLEVPESVVQRLIKQVDVATRHVDVLDRAPQLLGEMRKGSQVTLERPDEEYQRILLQACRTLAWSILGSNDFRCEVDAAWGVVQREGDYSPMQVFRSKKSHVGFSALLDIQLPPALSSENHDRPTKGSYGFHDGIHNILWKSDRTSDLYDLVQPGIIQCELVTGQLYVYPQQFQAYTYPFEGPGERKWICSTVALLEDEPKD